jgi:hypothetical protein
MSEEIFCMGNQSESKPQNNIVRFERTNMSYENSKPNEYPYQYDVFEDRPPDPSDPDLTQAEMEQIQLEIALARALREWS